MTNPASWQPAGFELEVDEGREGPRSLAEAELQLSLVLAAVVQRRQKEAAAPTQQAS